MARHLLILLSLLFLPFFPFCISTPLRRTTTTPKITQVAPPVLVNTSSEYIRIAALTSGSLLAGYVQTTDGVSILKTAISHDGAQSWLPHGEVFRGVTSKHDINNAFPLQLPTTGRILYAYRNHDRTGDDWHYTYFRISVSYSDDGGQTFKYLSTVEEAVPAGVNGLWEPFLRIASDGSLQCYYSAENAANDQDGFVKVSKDGGETWAHWRAVSGGELTSRDGMIGVASTDDASGEGSSSSLIAVFENTETGAFQVDSVFSTDDGLSWPASSRRNLYTAHGGNGYTATSGAPQVVNVGGTLVAGFMTNEDVDHGQGYDFAQMKVVASTDGGVTWGEGVVTGEAEAHWPGLFAVNETHFLATYSREGVGAVTQMYRLE